MAQNTLQEVVALRMSRAAVTALKRAAREADRSLGAEIRRRLMRSLADQQPGER